MYKTITKIILFSILFLYSLESILASGTQENNTSDIVVSIPPQKYFVEKIVKDIKTVSSVLGETDNPETYELTFKQLQSIEKANIFFLIGVPYEHELEESLESKNIPSLKMVDMGQLVERKMFLDDIHGDEHDDHDTHEGEHEHDASDHDDASEGDHEHDDDHDASEGDHEHADEDHLHTSDPHIWLSVANAPKLAQYTYEVLVKEYPQHSDVFYKNYQELLLEIQDVTMSIDTLLVPHKNKSILIYHPSLGYLSDEFNLTQIPIQWKGRESSLQQIQQITSLALENNIKTIFIQEGFPQDTAQSIAEQLNGEVVFLNPLMENWTQNIQAIANALNKSFETQ